jgi:hypothetical protein
MRPFVLVLSCLFALSTHAQLGTRQVNQEMRDAEEARRQQIRMEREQRLIVIRHEKNNQGNIDFYCENKSFCTYIVTVSFSLLINLEAECALPATVEVPPGTQRIFTLRKTSSPINFQYHFQTAKGCLNPKADTGFTYLLPIAPGKETHIFELSYIGTKFAGESKPKDYYVIGVHMHSGDTIYAARRGRVIEVKDDANITDSGVSYEREENYVDIVHDDCTFGKYTVFRDSSIFVHPGDWVEAGQPLGIVGGERYTTGPHVRFSVRYHLDQDILDKDGQPTGRKEPWAYVPMNFWVNGKGKTHLNKQTAYTSEHPADLITREMTKKEARKWKETHEKSR